MEKRTITIRRLLNALPPISATIFFAGTVTATEPCPPSPCRDSAHRLQKDRCRAAADWVAVGKISAVTHHPEGPPLSKDFAEFDFVPEKTEKGDAPRDRVHLRVGWCENSTELPDQIPSHIRLYGTASKHGEELPGEIRYLDLEPVE